MDFAYSQGTVPPLLNPPVVQQSKPHIPQETKQSGFDISREMQIDECDSDVDPGGEQCSDDNGDMVMVDFIEEEEDEDFVVPLYLPRSDEQRQCVVNTSKLFSMDRQLVNEAMGW